jgi:hypothetical protein
MANSITVTESKDGGAHVKCDGPGVTAVSADAASYEGGAMQLIRDIAFYDDDIEVTEGDDGSITLAPAVP